MTTALLRIDNFDGIIPGYPEVDSLEMRVLRPTSFEGMGELLLCELLTPISAEGEVTVTHVTASPRFVGTSLNDAPFGGRAANVSLIVDQAAVDRDHMLLTDIGAGVIGSASGIPKAEIAPLPNAGNWFTRLFQKGAGV